MRLISSFSAFTLACADSVHQHANIASYINGDYDTQCVDIGWEHDLKEIDNGQNGQVIMKNYSIRFLCYVNFGQACTDGVNVKIKSMNWLDRDEVYFTYKSGGVEYATEKMSGCLEGSD